MDKIQSLVLKVEGMYQPGKRKCQAGIFIVFESGTQEGGGLWRQEADDARTVKGLNEIPGEQDRGRRKKAETNFSKRKMKSGVLEAE